jgi:hypothetical protein
VSTPTTGQTPAGWYLDPRTPGRTRWWDGSEWTSQLQPIAPVEEHAQPAAARAWTPTPSDPPATSAEQPWSSPPQAAYAPYVSNGSARLGSGMYSAPTARRTHGGGLKALWALLTCVLVAALVVGYSLVSAPSGPTTFENDKGAAGKMVISWIDDGSGHLTGTVVLPGQDGVADPTGLGALSLTGTLHSGQVSLVVNMVLGVTLTFLGTLDGDTLNLTMNNPNGDGTTVDFSLARTSPSGKILEIGPWTWELPPLDLGI